MIASLGFEFIYNGDRRPVPKLCVWVRANDAAPPNCVLLTMQEVEGEDGELHKTLHKLFRQFLERFPNQPYSISGHVMLEIMGVHGSPWRWKVIEQMEDCWKKNKKRPMQRELKLRFEGKVKARVTCFYHEQ